MKNRNAVRTVSIMVGIGIALVIVELLFRYYYYRWNTGQSVPLVLFARPFPEVKDGVRGMVQSSSLPGVIYELRPNASLKFFDIPLITNSNGLIGTREYSPAKPPRTIRIAGIGDSFMFPWGIGMSETYLSVLGQLFERRYMKTSVEVMNFAVPGYNTAIEYAVFQSKVMAYHPDIIILGLVGNDMDLPNYIRRQVIVPSYAWFAVQHAVAYVACRIYKPACDRIFIDMLSDVPYANGQILSEPGRVPPAYRYMVGQENFLNSMTKMSELTQKNHIPIILITEGDTALIGLEEKLTPIGYRIVWGDAERLHYATDHGIDIASLRRGPDDSHYTALGHQVTATVLYDFMMQLSDIRLILEQ